MNEYCVAEHSVFILDEAGDINSLHITLQVVEILDKKLLFRLLIASATSGRPKYNWHRLQFFRVG